MTAKPCDCRQWSCAVSESPLSAHMLQTVSGISERRKLTVLFTLASEENRSPRPLGQWGSKNGRELRMCAGVWAPGPQRIAICRSRREGSEYTQPLTVGVESTGPGLITAAADGYRRRRWRSDRYSDPFYSAICRPHTFRHCLVQFARFLERCPRAKE